MPRRSDIKTILLLGSGPIVIGQACEFDYSCVQACKALRADGYRVVLVNSNPATIMTDPGMADAVYVEPIEWRTVSSVIEKERPCAILPTMGGQTALNCALDLHHNHILKKYSVEMIGVTPDAINQAEDRRLFCQAMKDIGLKTVPSKLAHSIEEALEQLEIIGLPAIIRPSYTLGGAGGGVAYNREEFVALAQQGLSLSPTSEILVDQSVLGWKEYEMEVVCDIRGNAIIVCSIENIDPMGIHTGDSIVVAPAQTLTDKEYQCMRSASIAVLDKIGMRAGGSNVQFAINPHNGDMVVVEMNPRVSRSSALASKATGFPIAKVAAQLAVGYTLDELSNAITGEFMPISFEPSLDYVVVKIPRFNFEKFPKSTHHLTTQMKSVGEVMAIGTTFQEALQKAMLSLEVNRPGFTPLFPPPNRQDPSLNAAIREKLSRKLSQPSWERLWIIADAFRYDLNFGEIERSTQIDAWFLYQIQEVVKLEDSLPKVLEYIDADIMREFKKKGFSDRRLATLLGIREEAFRAHRYALNVRPVYRRVDTCAAEFPAHTAYLYSTYHSETCEARVSQRRKAIVLGSGPNRIGQGVEFDYCCVHAVLALAETFESIMVNCNPETVSTDCDVSDRLYFEPLSLEHVLEITHLEKPEGVVVHCGGQTPLKLAKPLDAAGVTIMGTSPDAIDCAEDRSRFQKLVKKLQLTQPVNGTVSRVEDALALADVLVYPFIVRPSYVLGGRAMEIIYNKLDFMRYMRNACHVSEDNPLLLDHFVDNAIEIDVDAVCDGKQVLIGGVMEHIEQAGIHSGDSACSLPVYRLPSKVEQQCCDQMKRMALELGVVGFINAQFAWDRKRLYVLEVNPRASRTVPFVAKATGVPLATIAVRCMLGTSLEAQGFAPDVQLRPPYFAIKQPVFPFDRFPGIAPILGPEMHSTGEVMGVSSYFGKAFSKTQLAIGVKIPSKGCIFISVRDDDKDAIVALAKQFSVLGFHLVATGGTARALRAAGLMCAGIKKVYEGRPHTVDAIKNGEIDCIINTIEGQQASDDSYLIARTALKYGVHYITTLAGGYATIDALESPDDYEVCSLQDWYATKDV